MMRAYVGSLARICAAQYHEYENRPLHIAAANQASEAVVVALLTAHPGAAEEKCGVRRITFCAA